jgi:2-keto-4-pentenoate hydratase/2-oxohepta-3-ene-1,7-dioic acid hydratase in catechol pathway
MRLITYKNTNNENKAGLLVNDDNQIISLEENGLPNDMNEIIKLGESGLDKINDINHDKVKSIETNLVKIVSPIPRPTRNIMCVGKNYHDHAAEFYNSGFDSSGKQAVASFPVIFTKATTSVIGTEHDIILANDYTNTTDYEGELGLILGSGGKNIQSDDAYGKVFGYTIINDVSARQIQRQHEQWFIGKSPDTYCPMGPVIVTADEIDDVTKLKIETRVNGETRQSSYIKNLIFDIPNLISTISKTMTFEIADIIATGTPAGVGIGSNPPIYLKSGDRVEVEIEKIGILCNKIA